MAAYTSDQPPGDIQSEDGSHRMMERNGYTKRDWRFIQLSDTLEQALSNILRHGYDRTHLDVPTTSAQFIKDQIQKWVHHINREIPGYGSWDETLEFIFDVLYKPDVVPGVDTTPIGTERDLWDQIYLDDNMKHRYCLKDVNAERAKFNDHKSLLATARRRLDVLDLIWARYTPANPMPKNLAILFCKIRYAYKLLECLLGHVGYYNGSLEFAAGITDGFHRELYNVDLKLRRPDRMHPFHAPKPSIFYITGPYSEMPWNNQFSFCYGFHEFKPWGMPRFGVSFIERRIVEVIRGDKSGQKWTDLCALMSWDPKDPCLLAERSLIEQGFISAVGPANTMPTRTNQYHLHGNRTLSDYGFRLLTLHNIVHHLIGPLTEDEVRLKDFYRHLLGLPWSDTELTIEDNPFAQLYQERVNMAARKCMTLDLTTSHLTASHIKDPRIADLTQPPLLTLSDALRHPIIVGRKGNFILTPQTTAFDYRKKLDRLSEADLDKLFENIKEYPRELSRNEKIDVVVRQAVDAASIWIRSANDNRRPVYTGPSGHMITHAGIFLDNASGCTEDDHPNLEQFRITMLASMIGFKQHHSYDEAMFPTHGLEHDGNILEYKDRVGYRDIVNSDDPFVRLVGTELVAAAINIGRHAIASFDECAPILDPPLPDWRQDVKDWFKIVIGGTFPVDDDED